MLDLPQGSTSQVLWHKDVGDMCYEFIRVYGPDERLDKEHSFWLLTSLDQEDPIHMSRISFGEYKALYGQQAGEFPEFASPSQPPRHVQQWLKRKQASHLG
jgi:hypothetical protein